jgi:hypothetical protein
MPKVSSIPTSVVQAIHLNLLNEYHDELLYPKIQSVNYPLTLPFTRNNLKDTTGTASNVNLVVNTGALQSASTAPDGGLDPASDNVWCKQYVTGMGWRFNDGGTFKLTGLPANRQVKLYFHFNDFYYWSAIVNVTANGITSPNRNTSGNQGTCAGSPYEDPALDVLQVTTTSLGEINITAHWVSGNPWVHLTSLYIQILSN